VLVLSHSVWENRFASDRNIPGKTVVLSGAPWTVVGVMPPSFRFVRNHDL
jgi:putative ABC transport system permease protein